MYTFRVEDMDALREFSAENLTLGAERAGVQSACLRFAGKTAFIISKDGADVAVVELEEKARRYCRELNKEKEEK